MVLIPPDVGIRMRMQTEANLLQPVQPAHEIPSELPELRPGQRFSARVQEALPDNTYRAIVAGRQITLQLPESAKAGDQLELVVLDRTPSTLIAKQVTGSGASPAAPDQPVAYEFAKFSPAARLIGQLLPSEGQKPAPALLNKGEPLLPTPPDSKVITAQLAPNLAKAVTQSGLFYESHQAKWVTGQRPLAQILQEPQGKYASATAFEYAAEELISKTFATTERPAMPNATLQTLPAGTIKSVVEVGNPAVPPGPLPTAFFKQELPGNIAPTAQPDYPPESVASPTQGKDHAISAMPDSQVRQPVDGKTAAANLSADSAMQQARPVTKDMPEDIRPLVQPPVLSKQKLPGNINQTVQPDYSPEGVFSPTQSREHSFSAMPDSQALQPVDGKTATANLSADSAMQQARPVTKDMPEDIRPLVQQQLEAVSTNRLFWHGEVWPQQTMDWAIELENERQGDGSNEDDSRWNTSLSLTTPRLGRVDAMLQLNTTGVRIILATPDGATAADLRDEAPKLTQALELAGVPLLNLQVKHEDEHPAG